MCSRPSLQVRSYSQYVRMREHALGQATEEPTTGIEEGADIELPPVEDLQVGALGVACEAECT